jgi:DNA-binding NarL/FixJ family response regulator
MRSSKRSPHMRHSRARSSTAARCSRSEAPAEALDPALAIFEALPAPLWAKKTHAELARIAGRRPRSGELTPTEARVASLAAEGLANKEIASTLFVSVPTVEAHLSRIYRKLSVRSRTELVRKIVVDGDTSAKV